MREVSKVFKSMNGLVMLFVLFTVILSSLLIYLQKIDEKFEKHNIYRDNIKEIILLDQKLDNFFLQKYQYLDFDTIKKIIDRLDELLDTYLLQEDYQIYQKELKALYERKKRLVENFKSLNSRMANAVHSIYDLRRSIKSTDIKEGKKNITDEIFFQITQLIMDIPINREALQENINTLLPLVIEGNKCDYFLRQVKTFLKDFDTMKGYLDENRQIGFHEALRRIQSKLEEEHYADMYKQKVIALTFFGLAFFVLVLLILNYRKVIKTTRELLAFRYAIENSDNTVLITDKDRNITYVNDVFELNTGYKKSEVIGAQPNILKSGLMGEAFYEEMNSTLEKGEKWQGELINKKKDGSLLYEKASISPIIIDGKVVQYLAIKLDITDYIEYQNRLKQSSTVFENTQEGILILDENKKIKTANRAFKTMTGFKKEEIKNNFLDMFVIQENDTAFYQRVWSIVDKKDVWTGKISISKHNGEKLPIWLSLSTVRDKDGSVINYIAIYTDLSEVIRTQEKADFLAYHDSLTLLPNRAYFEKYMKKLFENSPDFDAKVAILFLDLDRFKVINDTLGHSVGDELLKVVAERITGVIGEKYFLARLGGDEFVIVLENMTSCDEINAYARKILEDINRLMIVSQHQLSISGSLGISLYPDHSKDADTLIRYADSAMYSAKEKGKNTYTYYEKKMSLDVHTRLHIEQRLKSALKNNELSLMYQPQYALADKKISGAEVLVRWHNSILGNVPPDEFIPIAEDTGLIIEIGYYIFEEACRTFVEWEQAGCELERISINLSSVQLRQSDFLDKIQKIMKKTGMQGNRIEIELTERILFEFSSSNIELLDQFREMGCEISIDDFGTGYSSMSYLKELPIDTVKIDKIFVDELPYNLRDQKVAKAIIALSKSLGYKVIAEGIETETQEVILYENRCDIGQGFYFSRPLDKRSFFEFAKEQHKKQRER